MSDKRGKRHNITIKRVPELLRRLTNYFKREKQQIKKGKK